MSKFEHYLKQYVWAGDKYPRELVVFRGPRFIDGALASPGDRWLLKNQTGSQRNGVYVVLKDEVNHISYTTQGGYRVNGKRVDGHNWVNHELDCYRLYPNAPLARRARWSK